MAKRFIIIAALALAFAAPSVSAGAPPHHAYSCAFSVGDPTGNGIVFFYVGSHLTKKKCKVLGRALHMSSYHEASEGWGHNPPVRCLFYIGNRNANGLDNTYLAVESRVWVFEHDLCGKLAAAGEESLHLVWKANRARPYFKWPPIDNHSFKLKLPKL